MFKRMVGSVPWTAMMIAAGFSACAAGAGDLILMNRPYGGGMWTINSDGTNLQEVSDFGWFGSFSKGGEKIAFSQYYKSGIWKMDLDGGNKQQLNSSGIHPSWSPDGSRITYATGTTYAYDSRVWVMNADGSGAAQLTTRVADDPAWAHYSDKIVFSSWQDGIWTIAPDGSEETRILNWAWAGDPCWTPDDSKILFVVAGGPVHVMDPDGSNAHAVGTRAAHRPSMGPDGRIVFEGPGDSIFILDTLTGTETFLADGFLAPAWNSGAFVPPYELGVVFSGVGLVPFSQINDGYATTDEGYFLHVVNAPFGHKMHIFGNFELARSYGVAYYGIQAAKWPNTTTPPSSSDYEDLNDSWGNYLWDPVAGKYVYHSIAPDLNNRYTVPPASHQWKIPDLLIEWDSRRYADGKYSLRMKPYRSDGSEIVVPPSIPNSLVLVIDNTRPVVSIDTVSHLGSVVDACAIVNMKATDPLDFIVTALDTPGHLLSYRLSGNWGENNSFTIASEVFDTTFHGAMWSGIDHAPFSYSRWPATCAYAFTVGAWSRTTNGYSAKIYYEDYSKHVTLMLH